MLELNKVAQICRKIIEEANWAGGSWNKGVYPHYSYVPDFIHSLMETLKALGYSREDIEQSSRTVGYIVELCTPQKKKGGFKKGYDPVGKRQELHNLIQSSLDQVFPESVPDIVIAEKPKEKITAPKKESDSIAEEISKLSAEERFERIIHMTDDEMFEGKPIVYVPHDRKKSNDIDWDDDFMAEFNKALGKDVLKRD